MIIDHPLLGPRDAAEFVYLGDACLIDRPDPGDENAARLFHDTSTSGTTPPASTGSSGFTNTATGPGWS